VTAFHVMLIAGFIATISKYHLQGLHRTLWSNNGTPQLTMRIKREEKHTKVRVWSWLRLLI
jgi:hypothetical protein